MSKKPTPNRAKRSAIRRPVPDDGTIVVAGAGVVENGWEPVVRALNRVARCHSAATANSRLASHVSVRRSLFAKHIRVGPEIRRLREEWVLSRQASWSWYDWASEPTRAAYCRRPTQRPAGGCSTSCCSLSKRTGNVRGSTFVSPPALFARRRGQAVRRTANGLTRWRPLGQNRVE